MIKNDNQRTESHDETCVGTHSFVLDWLFDRINLDPKIHVKYVDTKNQLADILTKGSFSRDEWNHLLCLFNIMSFQMYSRSNFSEFSLSWYCDWYHDEKRTRCILK